MENTEIAQKSYLEYERNKDLPDEAEAGWLNTRESLYAALSRLTSRQRQILAMIAVDGLTETEVAKKLGLNDREIAELLNVLHRTISYRRTSSLKKLRKIMEGFIDEENEK